MKNIFLKSLLIALPILAVSCQKEEEPLKGSTTPTVKGEYYAGITGNGEIAELFPGGSQTFDIRAYAHNGIVCDVPVTFSFKSGPEYVDVYNREHGTSYEMCPGSAFEFTKGEVLMPRYGTSSSTGKVKIVASGLDSDKVYILPIVLEPAKENQLFDVADTLGAYILFKQSALDVSKGLGTEDYPFLIYDADDLKSLDSKLQESSTVYFRLANDIDMTGVSGWISLNAGGNKLDFDGAGFSILNFTAGQPLFDIFIGRIHDINVTGANVTMEKSSPVGIVASRLGQAGNPGVAESVFVEGQLTSTLTNGVGGIFGIITDATVNACSASVDITSNKYDVGGICGYDNSKCTVSNCWTSGKIDGRGSRFAGGIIGQVYSAETVVTCCYSTCSIDGHFYFGGITGSANLGAKNANDTNDPANHIEKCIAWNDYIHSDVTDDSEHYSCGVVVGYTALKNYHVDCYRKADLDFKDCPGNSGNVLTDHANSSPDQPLKVGLSGTYVFPYHGKAAAAGASVSDIAKKLGWDETIWDLSGSLPFFKGASAPVENPDVPADGQLPVFDENEFYI